MIVDGSKVLRFKKIAIAKNRAEPPADPTILGQEIAQDKNRAEQKSKIGQSLRPTPTILGHEKNSWRQKSGRASGRPLQFWDTNSGRAYGRPLQIWDTKWLDKNRAEPPADLNDFGTRNISNFEEIAVALRLFKSENITRFRFEALKNITRFRFEALKY